MFNMGVQKAFGGFGKGGFDKGKGKSKGGFDKGKGKSKDPNAGKGHTLPRTRISALPFTGTVTIWKGKYGWIEPAEVIEHEKAAAHNGGLFFGVDDIVGGNTLEPGQTVEFHIFEDSSGLGAEEVTPAFGGGVAKGGFGTGFAGKGGFGGFGKGGFDKGKGKSKGGFDKGKGKSKDPNAGKGHTLTRTRISEAPFSGTVTVWKGKYGWIEPAEVIQHEKAAKRNGGLFFGMDDIVGGNSLEPGQTVEFHIFEDSSGLGAEEVTPN